MNDKGYLMMEAISSLLLLSCIAAIGLPALNFLNKEAAVTRELRQCIEVLENALSIEQIKEWESVHLNGKEYTINGQMLSDGFIEVCVRFTGTNGREYKKCGLRNDGMKKG
jgi:hypothetical protein